MLIKFTLSTVLVFGLAFSCLAQEKQASKPVELELLKSSVGVWDAEIEVWMAGLDKPSTKFKGVETVSPYGEYWISSNFDSEFMGQTTRVHSIVGYDLDKKMLVGTIIDHGPYSASMSGVYDKESKTVRWKIEAKHPNGTPMVQNTVISQKNANERVLVLKMLGGEKNEYTKFMQIKYVKRK